jgi:hypothetical protein
MDNRTLLDFIAAETDPSMRKVLQQYRGAEIELTAASEQLAKMGRARWSEAAASRARDVVWQAERYMRLEYMPRTRTPVAPITHDFADDAETNPRGYPRHTGLSDELAPGEVISSVEAFADTDPMPPPIPPPHALALQWCLHIGLLAVIVLGLWLLRYCAFTVN